MLSPEDDLRHRLPDRPDAHESLMWNVVLPDEKLFVIVYVAVTGSGDVTRLFIAFGADGQPFVLDGAAGALDGQELDDFSVAGLRVRQTEPLRAAELSLSAEPGALEYRFQSVHEAFDFKRNRDGCPPPAAENRFEQSGLIQGQLTLGERVVPFDTTGHRDHSWGVRDYPAFLHWKWISAQAGPDLAFHAMSTWWQGKVVTNGYVLREGILSPIVDLDVDVEYDDQMMQRAGHITMTDENGRTTRADAEFAVGGFVPLGVVTMAEAGCHFTIEGRDGVGVLEQGWPPDYVEHLRDNPITYA